MLSLSCAQLGTPDDPFVATGDDKYDVEGKMMHHMMNVHLSDAESMDDKTWADTLRSMDQMLATAA
jgi:predicted small metal-binding protein